MAKIEESKVYLEPIEHVYIHRVTGKKYTSVTKVLGSIEPHFEGDRIAGNIAKQSDSNPKKNPAYVGMNKEQILDYWQELNDTANIYGTMVHEIVERYLLADKMYFTDDPFELKVIQAYEDLKVDIDDTFFDIGDWKTNKEFNFFNKFGYKTLNKPFDHMQDCQYSIYSMQLSVYALMCEMETGMKCRQIWVGYWDKVNEVFEKIPIMYLKSEAKKLLEMHKYTQLIK
jgi:hypothetical protein